MKRIKKFIIKNLYELGYIDEDKALFLTRNHSDAVDRIRIHGNAASTNDI